MTTDEPAAGILPNREPGLRPGGEARRGHWLVGSFLGPAARLIGREPGSAGVSPASCGAGRRNVPARRQRSQGRFMGSLPPRLLALSLLLALCVSGCATRDVNPPRPGVNTGYVDFYTDAAGEFAWLVERFDERTQSFTSVFSEFEPSPRRALRLAFPPGQCRLRVTSQYHFVREPAPVTVEVKDGMITPVYVVLTPEGTGMMDRRERRLGRSLAGTHGRNTKITSEETVIFRLSAEASAPMPYQVKEQTSYAH